MPTERSIPDTRENRRITEVRLCSSQFDLDLASGNLLRFNLPILPSRSITAYTLFDCGASHKFVHPDFVARLNRTGAKVKVRHRGNMELTTAGAVEKLPLQEARIALDFNGFRYTGWFVVYRLSKYDVVLGKDWMEETPHQVNLRSNVLWLDQDNATGTFRCKMEGLSPRRAQRRQAPAASVTAG